MNRRFYDSVAECDEKFVDQSDTSNKKNNLKSKYNLDDTEFNVIVRKNSPSHTFRTLSMADSMIPNKLGESDLNFTPIGQINLNKFISTVSAMQFSTKSGVRFNLRHNPISLDSTSRGQRMGKIGKSLEIPSTENREGDRLALYSEDSLSSSGCVPNHIADFDREDPYIYSNFPADSFTVSKPMVLFSDAHSCRGKSSIKFASCDIPFQSHAKGKTKKNFGDTCLNMDASCEVALSKISLHAQRGCSVDEKQDGRKNKLTSDNYAVKCLYKANFDSKGSCPPFRYSGCRDGQSFQSIHTEHAHYNKHFQDSEESLSALKRLFAGEVKSARIDDAALYLGDMVGCNQHQLLECNDEKNDEFEWLPSEPDASIKNLATIDEISDLFSDSLSCEGEEYGETFLVSIDPSFNQSDLDAKLDRLSFVHESLYASSDVATLTTLEKFLVNLLQPQNVYGNLTSYGRLLAFINLSSLQRHLTQLNALYDHPEMSVIRGVLGVEDGTIRKTLNQSARIPENKSLVSSNEENNNQAFFELLSRITKEDNQIGAVTSGVVGPHQQATHACATQIPSISTIKAKHFSHYPSGVKLQKQLLSVLDGLSSMYKPGEEPHFPRFVCGSIDRNYIKAVETFSIPFEKSDKRNIHVQFEKIEFPESLDRFWPNSLLLPQTVSEGTKVQVAPLKAASPMLWKEGTINSIASGLVMIGINSDPEPLRERMYIMRNFVPPNVPIAKLEKGYWRLLPREIDFESDIYVGSCLSLLDVAGIGECTDVVILNIYYSEDNSPIALVKSPSDETLFEYTDPSLEECGKTLASKINGLNGLGSGEYMCACDGHTLRIFEGRCVKKRAIRILIHILHDQKEKILNLDTIRGYKLNYDIQAHFDGVSGHLASVQFPNSLWVVPRNIKFLNGFLEENEAHRPANRWIFEPSYCLIMFPFSRNLDILQDACRLITFLHPELNYAAICAGMWSVRCIPRHMVTGCKDPVDAPNTDHLIRAESLSCTRSQKAAIRGLTINDIVTEVCSGVVKSNFSLVRRLFGCHPVISLWIALEIYDSSENEFQNTPIDVKIPKKVPCKKCGGIVISRGEIIKCVKLSSASTDDLEITCDVPIFEDSNKDIPIFGNLEKTGELVERLQALSAARWRMTREFNASYSVDDEFTVAAPNYSGQVPTNINGKTFCQNPKFLRQLVTVMDAVRRSREVGAEDSSHDTAYNGRHYDPNTNMETALLRGWSAFLRQKQPDTKTFTDSTSADNSCTRENRNAIIDLKKRNPDFCNAFKRKGHECSIYMGLNLPQNDGHISDEEVQQIAAFNRTQRSSFKRMHPNMTKDYLKSISYLQKFKYPSKECGTLLRKSDKRNLKGNASNHVDRIGVPFMFLAKSSVKKSKTQGSSKKRPLVHVADCCDFDEKSSRLKFLARVKWDEDVEFVIRPNDL